jgi:hypothetical protein
MCKLLGISSPAAAQVLGDKHDEEDYYGYEYYGRTRGKVKMIANQQT